MGRKKYTGSLKVYLASGSSIKKRAVRTAFRKVFPELQIVVEGLEVASGINAQPLGMFETISGMHGRMNHLIGRVGGRSYDYLVSIENGLIQAHSSLEEQYWLDVGWVKVQNTSGRYSLASTGGVIIPRKYVEAAMDAGFEKRTAGAEVAKDLDGDSADPHSLLTLGRVTREELLSQALRSALGTLLSQQ